MGNIYLTGDTHQDIKRFTSKNFPEQKALSKEDLLIQLGDFGMFWNNSISEQNIRKELLMRSFTTLFIDGNHECMSKNSEILTENGWELISDVFDREIPIKIAQYDMFSKKISYAEPICKVKNFKEKIIKITGDNIDQEVSHGHDLIIKDTKIKAEELLNHDSIKERDFTLKADSCIEDQSVEIEDLYIRVLTWVVMDGAIIDYSKYNANSKKCTIQFKLSREDKISSLEELLKNGNIPYTKRKATLSPTNKLQPYLIRIYSDSARKIYSLLNKKKEIPLEWRHFNRHQTEVFLDTLIKTDGSIDANKISWTSTSESNINIVNEFCIKNGYFFRATIGEHRSGFKKNCLTQYIANIYKEKELNKFIKVSEIEYNDFVYCFQMPLGTLISRLNFKTVITGNCFPLIKQNSKPIFKFKNNASNVSGFIHLLRGNVYEIEGSKVFVMGGAESIDKAIRLLGVSYWYEELPSVAEMEHGFSELDKHNWEVDYVLTHTCPLSIAEKIYPNNALDSGLETYFEIIKNRLKFKKWYFGHHHLNRSFENNKFICLYDKIIKLGDDI